MNTLVRLSSGHETQSLISVREYLDSLPIDLIIEIFSRVPSKSIARFYCLSKFWASILRRPYFTELFLTVSSTRPRLLFTFKVGKNLLFFSTPQPINLNENSSLLATHCHTYVSGIDSSFYFRSLLCGFVLVEQSEGRDTRRVIINPCTRKSIALPELKRNDIKAMFGYDPIEKQFKVLCMYYSHLNRVNWILTLNTENCFWRKIDSNSHCPENSDICINGVLYYTCRFENAFMIACFDVRFEKFDFINTYGDKYISLNSKVWTLINYKGKLGAQKLFMHLCKLELWVLEDIEKHKWSKNIIVLPFGLMNDIKAGQSYKVEITNTGEFVFFLYYFPNPFYIFYCNFEKNKFAKVSIQGLEEIKSFSYNSFLNWEENIKLL